MCLENINVAKKISLFFYNKYNFLFLVFGIQIKKVPFIIIILSKKLIKKINSDAKTLIKKTSFFINGNGGGQFFFTISKGKKNNGLDKSLYLS